ncbi:3-hydroxybutyryl-CoA dehydrogenase [Catellatospora sp. TT07R-123]|uniref:3-hydroxyacyl-CoA dehydrogenase family protein n=1 Tax=Catellatospora sp. TT07R-123 TaxID=2733863 RepID=UPI001B134803|nr:3-hydroxyacyl-CoA dehydrogenase family protein [Catellatospora sp. TT07R-123]GHJ43201.1 3-hydroxybutyryl-CoA dehydrogenase [Catellatospora sp. TT07R-123]
MTHRLAVLGAGVMGTGIAALAVGSGLAVTLIDLSEQILDRARAQVTRQLRLARLIGAVPAGRRPGELTTTTDLSRVAEATAVVESVTERADVKASVLAAVSTMVGPGTVLISNTSAIPIDELARAIARPGDLLGVHFMNPAYHIATVEVVRGPRTSDAALAAGLSVVAALGREPIVVLDGPGFVINRVLQRMINESARIVAAGISSAEAVDALFTGCLGHRSGPLATADLIGLDSVVDTLTVLLERTGDAGYAPCDLLLAKVRQGELGRKSGRGFFDYPDPLG